MSSTQKNGCPKRTPSQNAEWNERFKDRLPHVFIGIVSFGDIAAEIYESHMLWALRQGATLSGAFSLSWSIATRMEQYRARNYLIDSARKQGADFLLQIDDDQTLHDSPDMIEKFWSLGEQIQGGLYWQRGGAYHPVIMKEFKGAGHSRKTRFYHPKEVPTQPTPVDVLGGGLMWYDMRVFDDMEQPYTWPYPRGTNSKVFIPNPVYGLDVEFCLRARDLGYKCWLNTNVKVGHMRKDREIVYERNLPPLEELSSDQTFRDYWTQIYANEAYK